MDPNRRRIKEMRHQAKRAAHKIAIRRHPETQLISRIYRGWKSKREINQRIMADRTRELKEKQKQQQQNQKAGVFKDIREKARRFLRKV